MLDFNILIPDEALVPELLQKINNKTKPPGALGKLEKLALQSGCILRSVSPALHRPAVVVFAGDHGIAREGVSPYPQEVTYQMVYNFLRGGAAINVFAAQNGMEVKIVDAGVDHDFAFHPLLVDRKVARGTNNFLYGPAMGADDCKTALQRGGLIVEELHRNGCNIIGFGEMGIGNTSSASAIMSLICNIPVRECIGRGTGVTDEGLQRKRHVIEKAVAAYSYPVFSPFNILCHFGGFEIAMICGGLLKAAELGMIILIDGFIVTAALLVAASLAPAVKAYCIFSHQSGEQAHKAMLEYLNADPLLHFNLRLGEGTGAALVYPMVQAAVNFLNQMASFEDAGVSDKSKKIPA